MKKIVIPLLLLLALPQTGAALDATDLLSLVAMPLAVAAVADLADVPTQDLVSVVTALNRAAVPPPQFIEVVRYVPVALVDQTVEPRFVTYVTTQVDQGVTGNALALAIADRLGTYGVQEINVTSPQTLVVVDERFFPPVVVSRFNVVDVDPLALVAMPLAVAAVADLAGIPTQDLISVVSALNRALVPPAQFIEVVRYVPVVLVDQTQSPQFVTFVTTQVTEGVTGDALAVAIATRLRDFGVREINVRAPPVVVVDRNVNIIPPVVVTRVAEVRTHPHGGPPGQLKKIRGVQTGAEIVHGEKPGRDLRRQPAPSVRVERADRPERERRGRKSERVVEPRGRGGPEVPRVKQRRGPPAAVPPAVQQRAPKHEGHGRPASPPGQEKGKPGKGKGKD